jgi:2-polyprenyl-6-methoxyphenol hydroxylase-like FAD-dependent oxidoreductase
MTALPAATDVLIVGGGPCGLMLANELGRRNVSAVLIDEKPGTAFNPQANATQARTMEHYRRLGFADEVRAQGMPPDYPTDIAYFTRFAHYELARFRRPSSAEAASLARQKGEAAELPHRVSQKFVEAILFRHAARLASIALHHAHRLIGFADRGEHVEAEIERLEDGARHQLRAQYLVGADGARSLVRQRLGFGYAGDSGAVRHFMGGPMFAVYLRAPDFYRIVPHDKAWMYVTFNRDRRALLAAVDGRGEFAFHTQLRPGENAEGLGPKDALGMFERAVGAAVPAEILSVGSWTAGRALVAEGFARGRVFLAGDAAHLFTPTGGLGYNTAVEDAVNLGWKLAAALKGQAGPALLASYAGERRALALRNTGYARGFADSLGLYEAAPEIEDDTPAGAAARERAGAYLDAHARAEFNIPGITFGGRYDGSPVICPDGSVPPPDRPDLYTPTATPGGRPPHLWLADGRSLFDAFGFEWTLLRLEERADGAGFARAAAALGVSLTIVDLCGEAARGIYAADLALIRPDQIVAWRGSAHGSDPAAIFARVLGHQAQLP